MAAREFGNRGKGTGSSTMAAFMIVWTMEWLDLELVMTSRGRCRYKSSSTSILGSVWLRCYRWCLLRMCQVMYVTIRFLYATHDELVEAPSHACCQQVLQMVAPMEASSHQRLLLDQR
jgi:hypothetical protein